MASPNHKRTHCEEFDHHPRPHGDDLAQESRTITAPSVSSPAWEEHTDKENEAPPHQVHDDTLKKEDSESHCSARCNLISLLQALENPPLQTLAEDASQASVETAAAEDDGPGFIIFEDETATRATPDEIQSWR